MRDLSELREAERRGRELQRLLGASERLAGMGSWGLELPGLEAMWSDGMHAIHGTELAPGIEGLLERVHPDDRAAVAAVLDEVRERPERIPDEGVSLEYRIVRPDGSVRDVLAHGRIERGDDGRPARWVGSARDVTGERLSERELLAHYAVSQALQDWASFEEGVVGLLRRLGTSLEMAAGALWIRDDDALVCRAYWSSPGFEPPGEELAGQAWRLQRPVATDEGLAFPAVGDGRPVAVLTFRATDRRALSDRLSRTLTGIGRELGRFLGRRRADLVPRPLSPREIEVLRLAADGLSGPQIADRLAVSPATIKTHFEHVYDKLGVGERAAAVALALRSGVID